MYHEKVSIPAKYRYFADFADFGPKTASDSAQSPEKWMVSPWSFPRKLEGAVGKLAGNTERKPGRVREETLGQAKSLSPNTD